MSNAGGAYFIKHLSYNEGPRFVKGYSINLALCMLLGVLVFAFFVGVKESNRRRRAGRKEFRLSIAQMLRILVIAHPMFRYTF
jgi:hypothetical protein